MLNRQERYALRVLIDGRLTWPGDTHGTRYIYVANGCRCLPCCAANRVGTSSAKAKRFARTAANGGIAPTDKHDGSTYANWGCGCDECKTGWATECRARYARKRQTRQGTTRTRRKNHGQATETAETVVNHQAERDGPDPVRVESGGISLGG